MRKGGRTAVCGMYVCMCMLVYVCDDDGGFTG